MQRARERGKRLAGRERALPGSLVVRLCACCVFAGVVGGNAFQKNNGPSGDPLVGEMVPPKPGLAPTTPASPASKSKSGVPPLQPTSAMGTAEVLRGQGDPLTGDTRPLAITAVGAAQPATAWQPNGAPNAPAGGGARGAAVERARPSGRAGAGGGGPPPRAGGGGGAP